MSCCFTTGGGRFTSKSLGLKPRAEALSLGAHSNQAVTRSARMVICAVSELGTACIVWRCRSGEFAVSQSACFGTLHRNAHRQRTAPAKVSSNFRLRPHKYRHDFKRPTSMRRGQRRCLSKSPDECHSCGNAHCLRSSQKQLSQDRVKFEEYCAKRDHFETFPREFNLNFCCQMNYLPVELLRGPECLLQTPTRMVRTMRSVF